MNITVKGNQYNSGKMLANKYEAYTTARDKLTEKTLFDIGDINLMVDTLVTVFDKQFTANDVKEDMEIDEIIFNFGNIDYEILQKVDKKVTKVGKSFTKGKKFKR